MRREFDEVWIIDLGGGGRGARKEDNVFAIQTPVAIFVGIQNPLPSATKREVSKRQKTAATVWYRRVQGTRDDKLSALDGFLELRADDAAWTRVNDESLTDFGARFVPAGSSDFFSWPTLDVLLPWAHSGAQYTRTWPIAPDAQTLRDRWDELFLTGEPDPIKFREGRDRKVTSKKSDLLTGLPMPALASHDAVKSLLDPVRFSFRSFDRMWCLPDARLGDYLRAPLWKSFGPRQLYFTSLHATPLGAGPAMTVSAYVPDLHHFRGSYGARDVFPAWRDPRAENPNVNRALLDRLSAAYGETVAADALVAYVFGLLGTGAYTERFQNDLGESSPRVPITTSHALFMEVSNFGRTLVAVGTYGERASDGQADEFIGTAHIVKSPRLGEYPDTFKYDPTDGTLAVGDGRIAEVLPEVWDFEVSGLKVVASWLGYRMAVKKGLSGPLDEIQPTTWAFDEELIQVLWAVEQFVRATVPAKALLERVISGDIFRENELPSPLPEEVAAPAPGAATLFDGL